MATVTLYPNAAGDLAQLTLVGAATHWEALLTSDGDTSYVSAEWNQQTELIDLVNLDNPSLSGTITNVSVHTVLRKTNTGDTWAYIYMKTGGTTYANGNYSLTQSYADYENSWATNPQTGVAWTWANIDALQAGISLKNMNPVPSTDPRCTQVYVVVTYTPSFIPKVMIL